ncbi:uncharacterized protein [Montipora capricornis]|uniref:uncharacterized protein n=1 Tax=Montipora foliosa TaxID=591990 RepID=UPI0035F18955
MKFKNALVLTLLLQIVLPPIAVARTGERLSIRLYNRDFQPPFSEVQQMLKKADLESHGYKKEVIVTAMKGLGSDFRDIEESQVYYKIVKCSESPQIEQELNSLMPGAFGNEVAAKLEQEIQRREINTLGECRAGLTVVQKMRRRNKRLAPFVAGVLYGAGVAVGTAVVEVIIDAIKDDDDGDDDEKRR